MVLRTLWAACTEGHPQTLSPALPGSHQPRGAFLHTGTVPGLDRT